VIDYEKEIDDVVIIEEETILARDVNLT